MGISHNSMSRRSFLAGGATLAGAAAAVLGAPALQAEAADGGFRVGAAHTEVDLKPYLPLHDNNSQTGQGGSGFEHAEKDYTAQNDEQMNRFGLVLIDYKGTRYAIVDCDHVNPPKGFIDDVKAEIANLTGTSTDNMWFHNPHNIVAPHTQTYAMTQSAVQEACKIALANMQPATFGYGEGLTFINTNRCYQTKNGWQQISNNHGKSDHVLPVLRFDDAKGNPIAILYTAHTASGVLENCVNVDAEGKTTGKIDSRTVSADVAGVSSRVIEKYYGNGCVALFFSGATGDQWCENRGEINYLKQSPKGNIDYVEREYFSPEAQWELLDIVSSRLGYAVIDTANKIKTGDVTSFGMLHEQNSYKALKPLERGAKAPFTYVQDTDETGKPKTTAIHINVMNINDVAITGFKSELNIGTLDTIRKKSPYKYNVMNSWTAFDSSDPDGYLPDQEGFDQSGKQASKTKFMPGTAEEMVDDAMLLLGRLHGDPLPSAGLTLDQTSVATTFGSAGFVLKATAKSDANIAFASSNPKVATVDAHGKIVIVGAGTAVISATTEATEHYAKGYAKCTVTVARAKQKLAVSNTHEDVKASTAKKKASNFKLKVAGSQGKLSFKKTSGSGKVKVSKNGKVTLAKGSYRKGAKYSAKVKVSAKGTKNYRAAAKTVNAYFKVK